MMVGNFREENDKILSLIFPKNFKTNIESQREEIIVQSGISSINVYDSLQIPFSIDVVITSKNHNEIFTACNSIFQGFHIQQSEIIKDIAMIIPEEDVKRVIGPKGKYIDQIRKYSGTEIHIKKYSPEFKAGHIIGTLKGILKAITEIFHIIYKIPGKLYYANLQVAPITPSLSPSIDRNIKENNELDTVKGCKRSSSRPQSLNNRNSRGKRSHSVGGRNPQNVIKETLDVPKEAVGWVLGKGKEGLEEIKKESGCSIKVIENEMENRTYKEFRIKGEKNKVKIAIKLIESRLESLRLKIKRDDEEFKLIEPRQEDKPIIDRIKVYKEDKSDKPSRKGNFINSRRKKLDIPKYQKVVSLVIGQTGSGKSTFINTLTNFFRNGNLREKKIAIPTPIFQRTETDFRSAESGRQQHESQTTECIKYDFVDDESHSTFSFIDTPGLSDTRGVEQDDKNLEIIISAITNIQYITSIIIVQNGSEARITASVKNSLTRIRNILTKDVMDNIILILTNSEIAPNFSINSLSFVPKEHFLIDNNAFSVANPDSLKPDLAKQLEISWNRSMRKIKEIAEYLCSMIPISTQSFIRMKEERDKARQSFNEAKSKLFNLHGIMQQLEEIKRMKESAQNDAKTYQNAMKMKTVEQIEWVDVDYHNTICSNDNHICHERCRLEYTPHKDEKVFSGCWCIGPESRCKECKCGADSHYHAKKIPRVLQKNVEESLQGIRGKINTINAKVKQLGIQEQGVSSDLQKVQREIENTKNELRAVVQNLRYIAPDYNISREIDSIIQQSNMQLAGERDQAKRLKIAATLRVLQEIYQSLNF